MYFFQIIYTKTDDSYLFEHALSFWYDQEASDDEFTRPTLPDLLEKHGKFSFYTPFTT